MTLRALVEARYLERTGKVLSLESPTGYNQKIQWLKVFDQMPEMIACCDKIAVRDYVAGRVGREYLNEVYQTAGAFIRLKYRVPSVIKASHDSGSVVLARNRNEWHKAAVRMRRALGRTYGLASGEWAYAHVTPRCFTERVLPHPVVDYKFHCVSGTVRWVQIIAERDTGYPLEFITDPRGRLMGRHFDHAMRFGVEQPEIPQTWEEMTDIAEELARPFRYVRVDLYSPQGKVLFGEMTFWPKSGFYKTADEPEFGELLDIDMSYTRPPVHP